MKKGLEFSVFLVITITLFSSVLSCNFFPEKNNNQEEEWPDDDEIRFTADGVPMRKIGIRFGAASEEDARALDLAVAKACINYFEVTLKVNTGATNPYSAQIFRASGTATLPTTIFYMWLPEDFVSQTIVDWNQGIPMICIGGYRHPKTKELYMLAFGTVLPPSDQTQTGRPGGVKNISYNNTWINSWELFAGGPGDPGYTESITFTMNALKFNVTGVKSSSSGVNDPNPAIDTTAGWWGNPGTQIPGKGGGNQGGYRAAAQEAFVAAAPFFIATPSGPGPYWVGRDAWEPANGPSRPHTFPYGELQYNKGYSTYRDGNYQHLQTYNANGTLSSRYMPYFTVPYDNDYIEDKAPYNSMGYHNGIPLSPNDGTPEAGIIARLWVSYFLGLSHTRFFYLDGGSRPALVFRPVRHAAGSAIPTGATLRKGYYPMPKIKGYVNMLPGEDQDGEDIGPGGAFWAYDGHDGFGFRLHIKTTEPTGIVNATGSNASATAVDNIRPWEKMPVDEDNEIIPMFDEGWVYMSLRIPFKVFSAPPGEDTRNIWIIRTGVYDDLPDLGSEVLSLGGGILLKVGEPTYNPRIQL
ncbi:MAG: hypothetical protein LBH97_01800 [Treponema sp.]|jgi:hypothetical protein|nr:hypothetical protein [Treponema sp.]